VKVALVVCILITLTAPAVFATSEVGRGPKSWDFAPLLYYDRVVRGTVVSSSLTAVSGNDLGMYPPDLRAKVGDMKITVVRVALDVSEVLRGPSSAAADTFLATGDIAESLDAYSEGVEVLVCMKYHPLLRTYYQGSSYGVYMRAGSDWCSLQTAHGHRIFGDEEIRAKIASMDIDHVASDAELVVEGIVEALAESEIFGPDSSRAGIVALTFKVASVKKGTFADDTVVVKAIINGFYLPVSSTHVPRSFAVGQRWLCFLKKNELGWFPFAGTNGLLRIEGDGFIYDERVPFWCSREQVAKAIADTQAASR
jgi:hypothetical protein